MDVICLDTYTLIEISLGNSDFIPLLEKEVVIPDTTIAEFYSMMYRKYNLKTAEYWYRRLNSFLTPVKRDILIKAMKYKIDNKKQNLSFFDCVGYIFALENNMKFVTGDREFKNKPKVEYIK